MWSSELKKAKNNKAIRNTACIYYNNVIITDNVLHLHLNPLIESEGFSYWMKALMAFDLLQAFKCFDSPLVFSPKTAHHKLAPWDSCMLLQDCPRCNTQTGNLIWEVSNHDISCFSLFACSHSRIAWCTIWECCSPRSDYFQIASVSVDRSDNFCLTEADMEDWLSHGTDLKISRAVALQILLIPLNGLSYNASHDNSVIWMANVLLQQHKMQYGKGICLACV